VEQTLSSLTPEQRRIAQYWGATEATARMIPMIFDLAEKYKLRSPNVARVLGYFNAACNDAFVMSWFFKYLWDVARPNQYGKKPINCFVYSTFSILSFRTCNDRRMCRSHIKLFFSARISPTKNYNGTMCPISFICWRPF
jgi:hypothetical protein